MNFEKIITEIKSVREFTKKNVDLNLVNLILNDLDNLNKIENLELEYKLVENGSNFFQQYSGKIGYFGKLIEAPSYILVFGSNTSASKINTGYNLEWVRFALFDAGIGSCWVSPMDNVNYAELFGKTEDVSLLGCLAIGEEYSGIFKKNTERTSQRKGVAEFVYQDTWKNEITWDTLEQLGLDEVFYLTKFAPSWGNCQPWAFIVESNKIKLFINTSEQSDYNLDAGIISFYFVKAAETKGLTLKTEICSDTVEESYDCFTCKVVFTM